MAVGTAQLISENATETMVMGVPIVNVERVYQIISDARSESVAVPTTATGLPALRDSATYQGTTVYVVARVPRRVEQAKTGRKWNVAVKLTNDTRQFAHNSEGEPVASPVDAVKTVDVDWVASERPIRSAKYLSTTRGPFHEAFDPVEFDDQPDNLNPDKVLTKATWLVGHEGPIINSAGDPKFATNPIYYRKFTVSRYLSEWNEEITNFLGKTNDAEVVIEEVNGTVKASYRIKKFNLLVQDVVKRNVWIGNTLYFKASIVLLESPESWIHSELDAGQRVRIFEGQDKIGGGVWTADELSRQTPPVPNGGFSFENIERNQSLIGDPEKLNGWGMTIADTVGANTASPPISETDTIFINFETYDPISFSDLDL